MAKTAKRNTRGQLVTDSALVPKGRKALMKEAGLGNAHVRSPLTLQLLATLKKADSYVSIPLVNGRAKGTTIFNLKDKAKRNDVVVHFTLSPDEKNIYAWFTKKPAIKAIAVKKGNGHRGPKRLETPTPEAVSA